MCAHSIEFQPRRFSDLFSPAGLPGVSFEGHLFGNRFQIMNTLQICPTFSQFKVGRLGNIPVTFFNTRTASSTEIPG